MGGIFSSSSVQEPRRNAVVLARRGFPRLTVGCGYCVCTVTRPTTRLRVPVVGSPVVEPCELPFVERSAHRGGSQHAGNGQAQPGSVVFVAAHGCVVGGPAAVGPELERVVQHMETHGPYDGVYAFSQAAALVTTLSTPAVYRDRFEWTEAPWRFAVLACGAMSRGVTIPEPPTPKNSGDDNDDKERVDPNDYKPDSSIRSLHIYGGKDKLLNDSQKIAAMWPEESKSTYTHQGGHEIAWGLLRREPELAELVEQLLDQQTQIMLQG